MRVAEIDRSFETRHQPSIRVDGRRADREQRRRVLQEPMLEAIKIVQPALESFYGSLTDEQKARFNQLGAPQG